MRGWAIARVQPPLDEQDSGASHRDGGMVDSARGGTSIPVARNASAALPDPSPVPEGAAPAGWPRLAYCRLHGSPRKYWSRYDPHAIATLAADVRSVTIAEEVWCVFDNTASGAAVENAWELRQQLIPD